MDITLRRKFWNAWVWANAWAEMLGLGATLLLGHALFAFTGEPQSLVETFVFVFLMTATGFVEGTIVGWFQWRVLRQRFENLPFKCWWLATVIGALTAWLLGSLPSSIMGMVGDPGTSSEPPQIVILALATAMGFVLGVILALPQWRVLRNHVSRAWVWLPANSLAWGVGMPIIFAGIDLSQRMSFVSVVVPTLFIAGAAVGMIHGAFLIRFVDLDIDTVGGEG